MQDKNKKFDLWFDIIVSFTFVSIAFFGLIMWVKFDKMDSKINEQRIIITKLLKDKIEVETENDRLKLEIDKRQQLLDSLMIIEKNN